MFRHFYHCTDGRDAVFDLRGAVTDDERREGRALEVARGLMEQAPGYKGFGAWSVHIHDEDGCCVQVVPFPRKHFRARAAQHLELLAS